MKLASMTLSDVTVQGLEQVWRWRWNETTPWPSVEPRTPTIMVHGHFFVDPEDGSAVVNLSYHATYQLTAVPALLALRDLLAPIVQQLLLSKETPLHPLFGGAMVTRLDIKNWAESSSSVAQDGTHPIGLNVAYRRFTKGGALLDGYSDNAMWERNPVNRTELYEAHRGPVDAARAAQFNAAMAAIWADLKLLVIQQEKGRLGL